MPPVRQHPHSDSPQSLQDSAAGTTRLSRWCSVAFVVLLAVAATLFYFGDLGRWNDDYFFLRQFERSAPSGDLNSPMPVLSWFLDGRLHFWRPLYRYTYTPIVTAFYQSPRALHILAACCHMGVSFALWGLMRSLGAGRTPAAIAGLAFMVYPAHFEGALWISCTPTPFATGLMLAAIWMQARWVRHVDGFSRSAIRHPVLLATVPAALAFAASCLNEQPAFLTAAMPLAILCERAGRSREACQPPPARWWTALTPTLMAGAAVVVYVLIANAMYPRSVGPNTGGVVTLGELLHRARDFAQEVLARQGLENFAWGAWSEGCRALAERPIFAAAVAGLLITAGFGWVWHGRNEGWAHWRSNVEGAAPQPKGQGPSLILLGLGIFVAGWAPLTFIYYPASPRLAYAPSAGLAIALAGLLEIVLGSLCRRPAMHIIARVAALPMLIGGALMMIGIQHAYRARWHADKRQGEALRRLVPTPSALPRPVFVPVRVADHPVYTGARSFDDYFVSPLISEWAAGWWLQLHYRRTDLLCIQGRIDGGAIVGWIDARSVQSALRLVPPAKRRDRRFELVRMIPFEVGEDGEVAVYTHVRLQSETTTAQPVLLPHMTQGFEQGRLPMRVLDMYQIPENEVLPIVTPTVK